MERAGLDATEGLPVSMTLEEPSIRGKKNLEKAATNMQCDRQSLLWNSKEAMKPYLPQAVVENVGKICGKDAALERPTSWLSNLTLRAGREENLRGVP